MSTKAKSIVEHILYEFFGKGNLSKYSELISKNVEVHLPPSWRGIFPATDLRSREVVKKIDQEYAAAFQFNTVKIEELLVAEDKILCRWSSHGVHKGNFFNIKTSHRSFHLTGQSLYQFDKEEQVSTVWQSWDMLGLMQQIKDQVTLPRMGSHVNQVVLSKQELDCLKHLLQGKTAKETALAMRLSFRTIESYFENLKTKLHCFRKRDLFSYARLLEKNHLL